MLVVLAARRERQQAHDGGTGKGSWLGGKITVSPGWI